MEQAEMEVIREVFLAGTSPSISEKDVSILAARLHAAFLEIWKDSADEVDQEILEFHYRRRMRFSQIAAEIGIAERSVRSRWWRLIDSVSERLEARVRGDQDLAIFSALVLTDPESFRFIVPSLLAAHQAGRESASVEIDVLKRAVETFGSYTDARRWLLDDCPALNGRPIDLVIDSKGAQSVKNVLGCIDHGMIF